MEEQVLRQKSRACWIDSGDANTKYFHAQLKIRYAQNTISSIYTKNGIKLIDPQKVETEFINAFTSLMGDCAVGMPYPKSEVIKAGHVLVENNKLS